MQTSNTSYGLKVHYAEIKDDAMQLPELKGWEEGDELRFEPTEVCEDIGDYDSIYLRNVSLEDRLRRQNVSREKSEREESEDRQRKYLESYLEEHR